MRFHLLAAVAVTGLVFFAPAAAHAQATHDMKAGCCDMPCCADHMKASKTASEPSAIDMLLAMNPAWTPAPAPPARQATEVWFQRPTMVGRHILQGRYVIEHDNDRQARGEPCTYIYAFNDRTKPVLTFHCTHLERGASTQNIATVATQGDMQVLSDFQFAGETAAHGAPIR